MIKFEVTAGTVAWYGAIVATISAIVSIYNVLRDRSRIRITYQRDIAIVGAAAPYQNDKTYFNVTVVNKGRRPIRIDKAGLRTIGRHKRFVLFSDSFANHRNRVLSEEQPKSEFLIEQDDSLLNAAWFIVVIDGTGRTYRKFIRVFPLRALFARLWNRSKESKPDAVANEKEAE